MPAPPPYMRFYPDVYLRDTIGLTVEEQGVYMRLLCEMWQHGGKITNDDRIIAKSLLIHLNKWRKVKPQLAPYLSEHSPGYLTQKKLREEYKFSSGVMRVLKKETPQVSTGVTPPVSPQVTQGVTPLVNQTEAAPGERENSNGFLPVAWLPEGGVARALAERLRPRWLVWENVPGVLSIDGGRTFGAFLGGLAECGYGFAYRILDAQYFGVPQRRRRVFVVGHLGDWRPAAAVLFEREGLCGDITPCRKARQSIAGTFKSGAGSGSWNNSADYAAAGYMIPATHTLRGDGFDASEDGTGRGTPLVAGTVSSKWAKGTGGPSGDECQNLIAFSAKDYGADADECAPTLRAMCHAESHRNGGGQIAVAIPLQEIGKRTGKSTNDASIGIGIGGEGDAMFTLQAAAQHGVAIPLDLRNAGRDAGKHDEVNRQGCGIGAVGDPASTLSTAFVPGVASFKPGQSAESRGIGYDDRLSPSLEAGGGGNNRPAVMQHMAVRRLTPRECERLQGFPDDYTLIPYRGKPAADGPRYKALGNSMAVPVMRWLGERIQKIENHR